MSPNEEAMTPRSKSPGILGLAGLALCAHGLMASPAAANDGFPRSTRGDRARGRVFNHVGTFSVPSNLPSGEPLSSVTSAEIVDVSRDGETLLYTDSPSGRLGFVDIRDPSRPAPLGAVDLGGEPTSVAVAGPWALVALNTSQDPDGDGPLNEFDAPGGELVVIQVRTQRIVRRIPLAGQPDSVAVSPDGLYAAVIVENERDEDEADGLLPQAPAGALQVIALRRNPYRWMAETIPLTGLAEVAPEDPEPEFVDINARNLAVVSLQENNHLVVIDLPRRKVINHFSAGSVTLEGVDASEEELGPQEAGLIVLDETITRRREPDAVAWIDHDTFATANEGDYEDADGNEGGSRGFTLFNISGEVEYESGASLEHEIVRAGHYPEGRSENKGSEPEGVEVGRFGGRTLLFVGAERANAVGVYDVTRGRPEFVQLLPTGIGPEGIKAIVGRGLLAVSAEVDGMDDGFDIRSVVTLYRAERGPASYPMLVSDDEAGLPIPWVAISGLSGDPTDPSVVWAVSDSFLAQSYVYRIDVSRSPAVIRERSPVGGPDGALDLEGIAARPEGGFWVASEGRAGARPNMLLQLSPSGSILKQVELPAALAAESTNSGFEGVTVTGSQATSDETLWVAVQREWGDDPKGFVKIGRYVVASDSWSFAHYALDKVASPNGGWVGLSEITALPNGQLAIIERDNQVALDARIKRIYIVDPSSVRFASYGEALPVLEKSLAHDLLSTLDARSISLPDKVEGVALTTDGRLFVATDNDGVDENYGETLFFELSELRLGHSQTRPEGRGIHRRRFGRAR